MLSLGRSPRYKGWRQRIELVLPYWENSDRLVAEIAWGELARSAEACRSDGAAPAGDHPASASPSLDSGAISHPASPRSGFVAGPADAVRLEQHIDEMRISHVTTDLGPMIAADLELRGPIRVGWVEAPYLADQARHAPEIEAAVLALSVLGDANRTIPRDRAIQAFRDLHQAASGDARLGRSAID